LNQDKAAKLIEKAGFRNLSTESAGAYHYLHLARMTAYLEKNLLPSLRKVSPGNIGVPINAYFWPA
jgi:hypothetical protein